MFVILKSSAEARSEEEPEKNNFWVFQNVLTGCYVTEANLWPKQKTIKYRQTCYVHTQICRSPKVPVIWYSFCKIVNQEMKFNLC